MSAKGARLGIDGGGSKTRFLLVDHNDHELAQIEAGPSNWLSVGKDAARDSLERGIAQLPTPPDVVCGGFAGAWPETARFFSETLQTLAPSARIAVETDAFIAYVGAIGLKPGVLLIAGTGSIAIGRRPDGSMLRTGGWGATFGDEGSGFWIGREAIRTALRAADRDEFPEFVSFIERSLGVKTIAEIVSHWASGQIVPTHIAALAPGILRQYETEPARPIVNEAAAHLRTLVETAGLKAGASDFPRSIIGSIGSDPLMRSLIGLEFTAPIQPPERGAITWSKTLFQ